MHRMAAPGGFDASAPLDLLTVMTRDCLGPLSCSCAYPFLQYVVVAAAV